MTDKEKIIYYLDYKGISKNKFYKKTGFSTGFLDKGSSLGVDNLRIIIDNYPDLSLRWFVMGEGEMIVDEKNDGNIFSDIKILEELAEERKYTIMLQKNRISDLENQIRELKKDYQHIRRSVEKPAVLEK
ncbi:hypothetical protein [Bergeyella zoohelcum]|uniref:Uncharacterized protein n=1 Tax=Bergeyella zoohelcum TaxID=1015 RepID=A0A376BZP8_9FLAO|nr:hypothetical protein [Bergeyella zoohelcum]EKB61438.1 hypothetical protein HMPREF9700_00933 [Bergeyella zoohelcum CCUG 30536]SSZ46470.1 Uncharacterised protein [Bergeyella zoohelcum]